MQAIAALGLGQYRGRQGRALGELRGDRKDGMHRRRGEFQFHLGNRFAAAVGDDPAAIQRQ
jgi:hypothetical protein